MDSNILHLAKKTKAAGSEAAALMNQFTFSGLKQTRLR